MDEHNDEDVVKAAEQSQQDGRGEGYVEGERGEGRGNFPNSAQNGGEA